MSNNFDPLFKSDSDWHNNACLNFQHDMSYGYIEGYKRAADALVFQIKDNRRDRDFLVYPIVFYIGSILSYFSKTLSTLADNF